MNTNLIMSCCLSVWANCDSFRYTIIDKDGYNTTTESKYLYNLVRKVKNAHFSQTAYKIRYHNLCIRFGTWKVWHLNQSRSKVTSKAKFPAGLSEKNG